MDQVLGVRRASRTHVTHRTSAESTKGSCGCAEGLLEVWPKDCMWAQVAQRQWKICVICSRQTWSDLIVFITIIRMMPGMDEAEPIFRLNNDTVDYVNG